MLSYGKKVYEHGGIFMATEVGELNRVLVVCP